MLLLYLHRHTVNCYHFNISKIIFLTLSDARMCVPVYIPFFFSFFFLSFFVGSFFHRSCVRETALFFSFDYARWIGRQLAFHVRLGIQGLSFNRPRFAHSLDLFFFLFLFSFFLFFSLFFLAKLAQKQTNYLIDK